MTADRPPRVQATLREHDYGRSWVITCPYCGEHHHYSAGLLDQDPRRYLGWYSAPCSRRVRLVYVLVEAERT